MAVAGNRGGAGGAKNIARAQRKPQYTSGGVRIPAGTQVLVSRPPKPKPSPRQFQQLARSLPKTPPRAGPVARARTQERAYASQGRAVEREAYRQKPVKARRAAVKRREPEAVKIHREREAAHVWADVGENMIMSGRGPRTPMEHKAVRLAVDRQMRADLRAPRKVRRKDRGLLGDVAHAGETVAGAVGKGITGAGEAGGKATEAFFSTDIGPLKAPKGGAGAAAAKTAGNILPDVAELAVTTPSSLSRLAVTTATHPKKVPGMLAAPYKQLAKDPVKFATEHPVSTALMLAPGVRMPGRVAGKVARVAGKQTLKREPARVAGTPLRVAREGPRGLVSGAVSARRERGAEPRKITGTKAEDIINSRVDEFFGSVEQPAIRRAHKTADRQIKERGYTGEQAQSHRSGVVAAARERVNDRFAEEFGEHAGAKARLHKHRVVGSSPATGARVLRTTRRLFTGTVLPYSTKWMAGQLSEAALRSLVSGAGPTSWLRARKLLRDHPEVAEELFARAVPGGFGAETLAKGGAPAKTMAEEFKGAGGRVERTAKRVTAIGKAPGLPAVRAANQRWRSFVFETAAGKIERGTQTAMLGKAMKDSGLMDRSVFGLSDKAIQQAAEGLKETHEQVALARQVRRSYGQYSHFSPGMREAIMHWTPFLPWFLNTGRFLLHTLPVEHPMYAALAADVDAATEDWRKANRLSMKGEHVPGFLMGSYPVGKRGQVSRVGHFLPFAPGEIIEDPAGGVLDLVLPQVGSAADVARGRTPFGEKRYDQPSAAQRVGETALELGKAFVPGVGVGVGVAKQGPVRQFVPGWPTKPHEPKRKKGKVKRKTQSYPGFAPLRGRSSGDGFGALR